MKRGTILHPQLSRVIAELGHGDSLVVADAGLPIPVGVERIDLAFAPGKPAFLEVLDVLLPEIAVEAAVLANELEQATPTEFREALATRLASLAGSRFEYIPHQSLKERVARARAVVRTGEFTPYANVILYSGVVF